MKPTYSLHSSVTDSLESWSSSSGVHTMNEYVKYMLTTGAGATCADLINKGEDGCFTIYLIVHFLKISHLENKLIRALFYLGASPKY